MKQITRKATRQVNQNEGLIFEKSSPGKAAWKLPPLDVPEVDTAKRKVIAADVLSLVHEYSDRLVPYFKNYIGITNDKVNGFVPPKFGVIETRKMWLNA